MIANAQIGRQNRPTESADERDFRHAFLIIESTKKGTTNRHVLCADSDMDRDSWIEVLVKQVEPDPTTVRPEMARNRSNSRMSSKEVVVTAAQPLSGISTADTKFAGALSSSLINSMESQRATPSSSLPLLPPADSHEPGETQAPGPPRTNGAMSHPTISRPLTMVTSPSSETLARCAENNPTPRAAKRQSAMPIRQSYSPAYLSKVASEGMSLPPGYVPEKERDRKAKSGRFWHSFVKTPDKTSRHVFGVPLVDSIAIASVANLPAIVFRCIEYLEARKAEQEEGIYRLSGSSAVIKGLKDLFDAEGDVNLLAVDEFWDPHAIAGLLKAFLRDSPTSLLTHDLHSRFLAVMGKKLSRLR